MPRELNPLQAIKQSRGAKAVGSLADQVRADMAAEKAYKAGVHYADPNVKPTMKFSEALGITGSEGKTLNFTETDRSRVKGENMGGFGFSGLQHYSKPHKDANAVWGFGTEDIANRKIKNSDPEKDVFTTYIGSPDQHKSNSIVVRDALKNVQAANQQNLIHPEQIKLINQRIRETRNKTGSLLFSPDFDVTDPQALSAATTFDRRSAISNALMGLGVKKPMISKEFKKTNPSVDYKDPAQMESILRRETEPMLEGLPNYSVGPRLFNLDGGLLYRPDLNFAFPHQPTGTDMGVMFEMPTIQEAAPQFMKRKGYKPTDTVNARAMSMGAPSQFVDEAYLTYLQKIGRKKGGLVQMGKGGVPRGIKKLKGIYNEVETSMGAGKGAEFEQTASPLNIMREGTGNWIKHNPEGGLLPLRERAFSMANQEVIEFQIKKRDAQALMGDERAKGIADSLREQLKQGLAKRQWVDSNVKNYIKKQMGTRDDPVRKLGEQGITHLRRDDVTRGNRDRMQSVLEYKRQEAGFPEPVGQSPEAKAWENFSDSSMSSTRPENMHKSVRDANPWIADLPQGERVQEFDTMNALGFENLLGHIDRQLLTGKLSADQLNKVSVPDAVRTTHQERMQVEKQANDEALEAQAKLTTYKEYPNGYKWVEISAKKDLPEGWRYDKERELYIDPEGQTSIHNPNYLDLQDALTLEGNRMGHCVGSYCNDVNRGDKRILSLRDKNGLPHATVSLVPEKLNFEDWYRSLPEAEQKAIYNAGYTGYNIRYSPQFKAAEANLPPYVKEMKGKQDEFIVDKYRPMVHDLVNTGNFSGVDDLDYAGLQQRVNVLTEAETATLKSKGFDVPNYVPTKDLPMYRKALDAPPDAPAEGMAKGGRAVRGVRKVESLADQVRAEMAAEKLASPPANVKVEPAYPYQDRLNKVKPVYGARRILPREQADANKAAFMEPSTDKRRLYHGTKRNFTRFSPTTADSIFLTPDPTFASGFAHGTLEYKDPYSEVAHGRFTSPNAKFKDPERSSNWAPMENPYFQRGIKALGHDAYYTKELDTKNLGVYNPNMVKSDIGNIGTYSTKTPEITEKKGGLV